VGFTPAEQALLIVAVQFQGLRVQKGNNIGHAAHPAKAGFQKDEEEQE
jgi:hypothetical protein